MELSPLHVTRLRAIAHEILRTLDPPAPAAPDAATLVQAWANQHLRYAPGHRVRVDDARRQCLADLGITMSPQRFGRCLSLPKQRSNGHTYYTGVKLT